jgi:hypothetical protein
MIERIQIQVNKISTYFPAVQKEASGGESLNSNFLFVIFPHAKKGKQHVKAQLALFFDDPKLRSNQFQFRRDHRARFWLRDLDRLRRF